MKERPRRQELAYLQEETEKWNEEQKDVKKKGKAQREVEPAADLGLLSQVCHFP